MLPRSDPRRSTDALSHAAREMIHCYDNIDICILFPPTKFGGVKSRVWLSPITPPPAKEFQCRYCLLRISSTQGLPLELEGAPPRAPKSKPLTPRTPTLERRESQESESLNASIACTFRNALPPQQHLSHKTTPGTYNVRFVEEILSRPLR
jgi:hypothetical protein